MHVVPPPPTTGAGDDTTLLRRYQTWKGSNVFLLQGRFIFGPDVRSLFLTVFLIVAPVVVFCIFIAKKLIDGFSHYLGISVLVVVIVFTLFVLVLLLMTSGRDPGIVPRNAHPPEPECFEGSTETGAGQTPQLRLPRTKDVVVNGVTVKIKYCDTCMLYRPPRCSHCSICNNCVEKFDHHCPWVGQCIGRRNYRFFFMFVFSSTLLCIYVFGFCWVFITKVMNREGTSIWRALINNPASIVLIIYSFITVWFVGGLTVFHLYLIGTNQSTYENFRYRYDRRSNPYNKGVVDNYKEVLCTSIPPSKNKFRAKVKVEPGIPPRVVGGSFFSPNLEKTPSDIETGRKAVRNTTAFGIREAERQVNYDNSRTDSEFADLSPDLSDTVHLEGSEGRGTSHPRQSSWGRRSGSWDMPAEVVSAAVGVGGSNRITDDNRSSQTRSQQK